MPRQRMVKPEFFDSESLGACSIAARLAFIGIWVMGDDYGNQRAQLSRLQLRIFPYDSMTADEFLGYLCELEEVGCIKGYEIDGERFITVPNFCSYQTVRKPSATNVPKPPASVEKQRVTTTIRKWRTSTSPVAHDGVTDGSDALVTHYDGTSIPELSNEVSNFSLREKIANESSASDAADADKTAPPSAPICPTCSEPLIMRIGAEGIAWRCKRCGEVPKPAFGVPKAVIA